MTAGTDEVLPPGRHRTCLRTRRVLPRPTVCGPRVGSLVKREIPAETEAPGSSLQADTLTLSPSHTGQGGTEGLTPCLRSHGLAVRVLLPK